MRLTWLTSLLILLLFAVPVFAQNDCPALVAAALQTVAENCDETGRNQACYGNVELQASPRADVSDFTFATPGALADVADIESLSLSNRMDDELWGISLLKVQADTTDDVTLLLFGEVEIENAVPPFSEITVTTTANARARSTPSSATDTNVLVAVPSGTSLTANGRNEGGDWLRVVLIDARFQGQLAWISASVLSGTANASTLNVVDVGAPVFGQMQAFYLTSGGSDRPCEEAPDSGILIQTPEGAASISFLVNEVNISLGSTAYIQAGAGQLQVNVIEGKGRVTADGTTQFVPAGTFTTVPLSADGRSPTGTPTEPQPYDAVALSVLPVGVIPTTANVSILPQVVEVAPPVPEEEIPQAIEAAFAPNGAISGGYLVTDIQRTTLVPLNDGRQCGQPVGAAEPQSVSTWNRNGPRQFLFAEDGLYYGGIVLGQVSAGVFGDNPGAHEDPVFRSIPTTEQPTSISVMTVTVLSPTRFQWKETFVYGGGDPSNASGACQAVYTYEWASP